MAAEAAGRTGARAAATAQAEEAPTIKAGTVVVAAAAAEEVVEAAAVVAALLR